MTPFEKLREELVDEHKNRITVREDSEEQVTVFFTNGAGVMSKSFAFSAKNAAPAKKAVNDWIAESRD